MPKVLQVTTIGRKKEELRKYITGKRHAEDVTLSDLGNVLYKTPQAVSQNIHSGNITYADLIQIFKRIGATDEEILKVMRI